MTTFQTFRPLDEKGPSIACLGAMRPIDHLVPGDEPPAPRQTEKQSSTP
jgi:hypothetical protein